MRKTLLLVSLAILFIVPSTAAQDTDRSMWIEAGVPVKFAGPVNYHAKDATVLLRGDDGRADTAIRFTEAHLTLVTITTSYTVAGLPVEQTRAEETASYTDASLVLAKRHPGFQLAAHASDAMVETDQQQPPPHETWTQASAHLTTLLQPQEVAPPVPAMPVGAQAAPIETTQLPSGVGVFHAPESLLEADVTRLLLVQGGVLVGADSYDARTEHIEAPGSVWSPDGWIGPGTHDETRVSYVTATFETAQLRSTLGTGGMRVASSQWSLDVDGMTALPWAEGTIQTHEGEDERLSGDQLLLGGQITWTGLGADVSGAPRVTLLGHGDVRFLHIGNLPPPITREEAALAAGAAAGAAAAVGAVAWYWPVLKFAAGTMLAPLYARVRKDQVLDHKGRELVYELVKGEPGISTNRLAEQVDFGWSTLTYHLRVLERNEIVVSVRDGRYKRFFDRQSGRYANGRKLVVSVLKNDATRDLVRHILRHPGVSQKEVGTAFDLAPSSVHWHVTRLAEAELVKKIRDRHRVRYYPGAAWTKVDPADVGIEADLVAAAKTTGPSPPALAAA